MHRQRLSIVLAAALGMLATFMPWVNVPLLGAVAGTQGDGWITLVLFAVALGLSVAKEREAVLDGPMLYGAVAAAGLAAALGLWKIVDFKRAMGDVDRSNPFAEAMSASVSIGVGLYLVVAAGVAVAVLGLRLKDAPLPAAPAAAPAEPPPGA